MARQGQAGFVWSLTMESSGKTWSARCGSPETFWLGRRSVPANLVFIGFSGTGKSAVSRLVAERLGWPLVDTDRLIVEQFGKSIAAVFQDEGEAVFRAAEREIVARACEGRRRVISVGGGAPVDLDNRSSMRDGNIVVQLAASPETIYHRLRTSPGAEERPMLAGSDPLLHIRRLLTERNDAYGIADVVVDTEGKTPEEVTDAVLDALERQGLHSSRQAGEKE